MRTLAFPRLTVFSVCTPWIHMSVVKRENVDALAGLSLPPTFSVVFDGFVRLCMSTGQAKIHAIR